MNSIARITYVATRFLGFDLSDAQIRKMLANEPLKPLEEVRSVPTNNYPGEPQICVCVCRPEVDWP